MSFMSKIAWDTYGITYYASVEKDIEHWKKATKLADLPEETLEILRARPMKKIENLVSIELWYHAAFVLTLSSRANHGQLYHFLWD